MKTTDENQNINPKLASTRKSEHGRRDTSKLKRKGWRLSENAYISKRRSMNGGRLSGCITWKAILCLWKAECKDWGCGGVIHDTPNGTTISMFTQNNPCLLFSLLVNDLCFELGAYVEDLSNYSTRIE